jgi:taurine dioxygenase
MQRGTTVSMIVKRLSYGIGAEIQGVDLRGPIAQETIGSIREVWVENCIVLFRGQELTPQQHIDFSARFGPLDDHQALYKSRHPEYPQIFIVTTRPNADGTPSNTRETGVNWHSDLSYTLRPATGSLLYCLEIPEVGGDTRFANMYLAYETLSDGVKRLIEPLQAVHSYAWAVHDTAAGRDPAYMKAHIEVNPPVAQPIVRIHPETGRKALYVSEGTTTHIAGMTREESLPILQWLYTHSVRPEFTYRHQWRRGDLIMWDNRSAMHQALRDRVPGTCRHMHRTTILGEPSGVLAAEAA